MSPVRRSQAELVPWAARQRVLSRLPNMPYPGFRTALEDVLQDPRPDIRHQAVVVGAKLCTDEQLVDYLRESEDDVLRSCGLEMIKLRGDDGLELALSLLGDDDPQVVLHAVEALQDINDPRSLEFLAPLLDHPDENVVCATALALGKLGDLRSVPLLLPLLNRSLWLTMAGVQALGEVGAPEAVPALASLVHHPEVGFLACESLAMIGGSRALAALTRSWIEHYNAYDPAEMLQLIQRILQSMEGKRSAPPGLRRMLSGHLRDPDTRVCLEAARCLLTMGPSPDDGAALVELAAAACPGDPLPACLGRRMDLVPELLGRPGVSRDWGWELALRDPDSVPGRVVRSALSGLDPSADPSAALELLVRRSEPPDAELVLKLLLELPAVHSRRLSPLLERFTTELRRALNERNDLDPVDRLVIAAELGEPAQAIAATIDSLPDLMRLTIIGRIRHVSPVLRKLSWVDYLKAAPEVFAARAASIAVELELDELVPALRGALAELPDPDLVRAVGHFADADALPVLEDLLEHGPESLKPLVLDALGRIGGARARALLRRGLDAQRRDEVRAAYRGLAMCAEHEDLPLFRAGAEDEDWNIRLSCLKAMDRLDQESSRPLVRRLMADPVLAVAQFARSFLGL